MTAVPTVTIAGTPYQSFISLVGAAAYINKLFGPVADAWRALSAAPDTQGRTVMAAVTLLCRQAWQGDATGIYNSVGPVTTTLAWPRSGVVDADGNPVDSTTVPQQVIDATCELTLLLYADSTVYTAKDSGSNVSTLKAGPVEVAYFKPTTGYLNGATKLPSVIMDLVGVFLGASGGTFGKATGTDACSQFDDQRQYTRSWGF